MSLNMKDVTTIVDSNGNYIDKIQDSNGNTIWGSRYAFPYRRLEYIHFSGTEYIDTSWVSSNPTRYYQITASITEYKQGRLLSSYDSNVTNAARRFYLPEFNNNGMHACIGSSWGSYLWNKNSVPINQKIIFKALWTKSTTNSLQWSVEIEGDSSSRISETITGTSDTLSSYQRYYLFATNDNGSPNYSYGLIGNLYKAERRNNNTGGTLVNNFIPCQRKSDNVCGVFDTVARSFRPMQGTNITTSAAGPLVDEYWNLTA